MTDTAADWHERGARDYDDGVPEIGAPTGPGRENWLLGWQAARAREERGEQDAAERGSRCADCRWWEPPFNDGGPGTCRAVTPVRSDKGRGVWPMAMATDWCAAFEARQPR